MQNCMSWRKHLKLICTKYQKEDMHSDSHLIFDRTQLSAAVESLCNCSILRLHTGDKPYETSKSLWMALFNCNDSMLSNQIRCGRDKRQGFVFYDTSHQQKWQTFLLFTTAKEHCLQSHWCQLGDKAVHCFQIQKSMFGGIIPHSVMNLLII